MKMLRTRIGIKALVALVGLFALLLWALKVSRESQPSYLYAAWLGDGDESRRSLAAQELGGSGVESALAIPALTRALQSDSAAPVRKRSAVSLARVVVKLTDAPTTAAAASALVEALRDRDPAVRAAAADGLGRIGPEPEAVIPALLRAAGDENEGVRGAAVTALGLIQKKAGIDSMDVRRAIASAMKDPSFHVREMGIYAFWSSAEKSPAFSIALLQDGDVRTRRSALAALGRHSGLAGAVVPELTSSLADEDAIVRAGAARVLGGIFPPPRPAIPALTRALGDEDRVVREAASNTLFQINGGVDPLDPPTPDRKR
jgi:HEAT repeat protein